MRLRHVNWVGARTSIAEVFRSDRVVPQMLVKTEVRPVIQPATRIQVAIVVSGAIRDVPVHDFTARLFAFRVSFRGSTCR
jgi:hypothetical protein